MILTLPVIVGIYTKVEVEIQLLLLLTEVDFHMYSSFFLFLSSRKKSSKTNCPGARESHAM